MTIASKLTPDDKIGLGREWAVRKFPYFTSGVWGMMYVKAPDVQTAEMNRYGVLRWNPEFIDTMTPEETGLIIVHELMHLLFAHPDALAQYMRKHYPESEIQRAIDAGKRGDASAIDLRMRRDAVLMNWGMDMFINSEIRNSVVDKDSDQISEEYVRFMQGCLFPSTYQMSNGLSWMEYFAYLRTIADALPRRDSDWVTAFVSMWTSLPGGEKGRVAYLASLSSEDRVEIGLLLSGVLDYDKPDLTPEEEELIQKILGQLTAGGKGGQCGDYTWFDQAGDPPSGTQGKSSGALHRIRMEVANRIADMISRGGFGNNPGMLEFVDFHLTPPKLRWQDALSRHTNAGVASARRGSGTTTYRKPGRRQSTMGFGRHSPIVPIHLTCVPNLMVVLDTSGSMLGDLSDAVSEVANIIDTVEANTVFVSGDCNVADVKPATCFSDIRAHVKGGGGTDFRPPFQYAGTLPRDERPHVIIYVTDGEGPAPECKPQWLEEAVWVLIGSHRRVPANWGKLVFVPLAGEDDPV